MEFRFYESAEAAFATLIARHGPMVHRVCLDVSRDREEARDAAQAVFLVVPNPLLTYVPETV